MVTKRFSLVDIAEMNLNSGDAHPRDRISKSNTGMGISPRIKEQTILHTIRCMNMVNQRPFTVFLKNC